MTYTIKTTDPAPSMWQQSVDIQASNYREAVQLAHESWRKTRRFTSLVVGTYCYHWIDGNGKTMDRCTNGGVPATETIN